MMPRHARVCNCGRTARLVQSAQRDPSQLVAGRLQTLSENLLLYPAFLLTLFLLLLDRAS